MLVIPKTKQMASKMLDFPLPLRPVMELKLSSLISVSNTRLSLFEKLRTILRLPYAPRTT
jgi:hypothetical protein